MELCEWFRKVKVKELWKGKESRGDTVTESRPGRVRRKRDRIIIIIIVVQL